MTAAPSIDRPVDVEPAEPVARQPVLPRSRRGIPRMRIGALLGVLVPLAIMVRYAIYAPPAFDGAMNLQVATNMTHGLGFARQYGGTVLFPAEIQTSGVYIFLAAGLIKVFGASTFVFELPNLIFLAGLLAAVSLALRRWPVLRIIGPSAVLFCVPGMVENSTHGYGEYVVAAVILGAFALVGAAAYGMRRPVLATGAAWVLVGVAFTVKVIALLAVPVLVLGMIGLALARPNINRWKLSASVIFGAIPILLVELQRLFSLGSVSAFVQYWKNQIVNAGAQAGVTSGATGFGKTGVGRSVVAQTPSTPILQKIADHVHLLAVESGINAIILILLLALPFAVLVGLFLARRCSWRTWLAKPGALLSVMLATYAGGYLIWWLAITPTSKAWIRRVIIALVAVALLYLVLMGMAKDHWNSRKGMPAPGSARRRTVFGVLWGVVGVLGFISVLPGITTANRQLTLILTTEVPRATQVEQLAAFADQMESQGETLYGNGWWSAPVVALYADLPLGNLALTDRCSADIVSGKAYLIWDYYAIRLASPQPHSTTYTFTQVPGGGNDYGTIWKITPRPGLKPCPAG